mmetsp:Transcript_117833/g.293882  ORF Transcript_117833/g.293882 Transcript_117833/m.293882 type:complete len:312 (+) Transcript_117833:102-1037(+)
MARRGRTDLGECISLEEHLPQHLLCPISHCIMDQPVVAPSGHTYDRAVIAEWLARRPVDPLSNAPLSPLSLYPNRALQEDIIERLDRLAENAIATGEAALAEAARAKMSAVRAAMATAGSHAGQHGESATEAGRLDRWVGRCACLAVWCGEFVREQALVFTTSLGALLCLALDLRSGAATGRVVAVTAAEGAGAPARPMHLLSTFMRMAVCPTLAPPKHWMALGRLTLVTLRCMLLVPMVPACIALSLGSVLSLARFAQRFVEVRAIELERAAQNRWWIRTRDLGSAVTGFASFGLFLRLYVDWRAEWRRG